MAYVLMACELNVDLMAHLVMAHLVVAYVVMAYVVMAYELNVDLRQMLVPI